MRDIKKLETAIIKKINELEHEKGEKTKTGDYKEGFNDCLELVCSAFQSMS